MRNFGVSLSTRVLVLLVGLSALISISSAATSVVTKEHKKKLIDKLRATLNSNDPSDSTVEDVEKAVGSVANVESVEDVVEEAGSLKQDAIDGTEADKVTPPVSTGILSTHDYMARFRNVVKRVLEMLGLRRTKSKDGRSTRMMELGSNDVDIPVYREEVRTTVGAVMGQKECLQKVACVSGTYLKEIKGKQLIFALLESFSPSHWKETVRIAKQSAIFNDKCNYKCLE